MHGLLDSVRRGWTFAVESWRLALRHPALRILPLALVAVVLLLAGVLLGLSSALGVRLDEGEGILLDAVAILAASFAYFFLMGATVSAVEVALRGGRPSVREALLDAGRNVGAIAMLALVSTMVELLARALRPRRTHRGGGAGDALLGLAASALQAAWTVLAFLLLPAILIEDIPFGEAMRRVREIHARGLLPIAVGEVGVRLVGNLALFAAIAVVTSIGFLALAVLPGPVGAVLAIVVAVAVLAVAAAFQLYTRAAYYTCLYVWAAAAAEAGAPAPAPAAAPGPLRAALAV
ncbi:MAG: DUF6159 family protein [Planctomycetales bacterium]|nr:DUF6159 family protein [Planctomycetales bacterium]